jgi:predicted flavoprotein YhiN
LTEYGLEGNAIYPIASEVRNSLNKKSSAKIFLDLKPHNTHEDLKKKITSNLQPKNYAYTFKLNKLQVALIKSFTDKETYLNPVLFTEKIKALEIPVKSLRPFEEAISTIGGIDIEELNESLSLKKFPNIFIAGEMFDWDTITGGYLLQGCFSTGYHVAQNILKK